MNGWREAEQAVERYEHPERTGSVTREAIDRAVARVDEAIGKTRSLIDALDKFEAAVVPAFGRDPAADRRAIEELEQMRKLSAQTGGVATEAMIHPSANVGEVGIVGKLVRTTSGSFEAVPIDATPATPKTAGAPTPAPTSSASVVDAALVRSAAAELGIDPSKLVSTKAFINEHLSVSRLKLFEQCERAFAQRYIAKAPSTFGGPAAFGVLLHAVLERLYAWAVANRFMGQLSEEMAIAAYREEWATYKLIGVDLYAEGIEIIRAYLRRYGEVDASKIVAVEQEFKIKIGAFGALGYIDRVDRVADDHIMIVDYKSNWLMFSKEELDNDLQMSIYGLAARELWPWARKISFGFHMLRHGLIQTTDRTAKQIDDHAGYVEWLGRKTEDPKNEFKPRLNENCSYCDYSKDCPAFIAAIEGKHAYTKGRIGTADFATLVGEREAVAKVAKAAYARKSTLDDMIKAALKKTEKEEIVAGGVAYRFIYQNSTRYPMKRTIEALTRLGASQDQIDMLFTLAKDNVKKVAEDILAKSKMTSTQKILIQAEVEALAEVEPMTPKLDARPFKVREAGGGKEKTT